MITNLGVHDVNITVTIPTVSEAVGFTYDTDELENRIYHAICYRMYNLASEATPDQIVSIKITLSTADLIFEGQPLWDFTEAEIGMTKAQEAFVQFFSSIYNISAQRDELEDFNYYSPYTNGEVVVDRCFPSDTRHTITNVKPGDVLNNLPENYITITREEDSLFCSTGGTSEQVYNFVGTELWSWSSNCGEISFTAEVFKYTPNGEIITANFYIWTGSAWSLESTQGLGFFDDGNLFTSSGILNSVNAVPLAPNTEYLVKVELVSNVGAVVETLEDSVFTSGNISVSVAFDYNADAETVYVYYTRLIGGNDESVSVKYRIRTWNAGGGVWNTWQEITKTGTSGLNHTFTGIDTDKFEVEVVFDTTKGCSFTLTDANEGCNASATGILVVNKIEVEGVSPVLGSITATAFNTYFGSVNFKLQNLTLATETGWTEITVGNPITYNSLEDGDYLLLIQDADTDNLTCVNSYSFSISYIYRATRDFTANCAEGFTGSSSYSVVTYDSLISINDAISNALAQATAEAISGLSCTFDLDRFTTLSEEDTAELFVNESFTLSYTLDDKGHWVSFHSYIPDFYINTRTKLFNFKDGVVFENNKGERGKYYTNEIFPMIIEPVFNGTEDGMQYEDKMFFNINWNSEIRSSLDVYLAETFSRIRVRNSTLDTTEKILKVYQDLTTLSANTRKIKSRWNFDKIRNDNVLSYRRTRALDTFILIDLIFWNNQNKVLYLFDIDSEFSLVQR